MMVNGFVYLRGLFNRLRWEEDGLALTEYLILLGLLTAVVVIAVITFGENLGLGWQAWADWLTGLNAPPALPT
ncbi:hypothetical protein [Aestuariicoccus sp. MJ-SS9]|uniref:Flp family type IVb pilin n=1 Tax=Aestuariicoccus sp. MJ-SS9 TaxID=3079855 RepID=UPI002905F849|nr:hypothetical protein [Aestuariicoccus sp. MJ-SS9]MDU8913270.1 hypothetical protein [Aestuariicoccus sp. MJ-SS9]